MGGLNTSLGAQTSVDPMQALRGRSTIGPVSLAVSSVLLLVFPLIRPFTDRTGDAAEAAATFASTSWVIAHVVAGLGFVLLPVALSALYGFLRGSRGERCAAQGVAVSWIGIGLILPTVFGTEAFALRAVGQAALQQKNTDLLAIAMSIRMGPQARFFFPGLLVLAIGAGLLAAAVWRSGTLPRWSGVTFALGLTVFFPPFPQIVRVIDGLLIGTGGVWIALGMLRDRPKKREEGER